MTHPELNRRLARGTAAWVVIVAAGSLAAPHALASGLEADLRALAEADPADHVALRNDLIHDGGVSTDALVEIAGSTSDWQVRLEAQAVISWRTDVERAEAAWAALPATTRAGFWRFTATELTDPLVTPVLLERMAHADEHAELRGALAEVIARTTGEDIWEVPFAAWLSSEPSAYVREGMVHGLRDASAATAIPALTAALDDPSPGIRAEAARSLTSHKSGALAAEALRDALSDRDASVRAAAARALGVLGVSASASDVAALASDADAEVRLQVLHALDRLDRPRAAAIAIGMQADSDARVSRLAVKLAGGAQ
jgi:HEAT repeat protein